MNIDSRIQLLKKQIEMNLSLMSNRNLSNDDFVSLADVNRIRMKELTMLYKIKNEEIDQKMNEFQREEYK